MRPRGPSASSPVARKVGHAWRQKPQWTQASSASNPPRSAMRRVHSEPSTATTNASPGSKVRSEEHTSELQSLTNLVCRLLLEKKKKDPQAHQRLHLVATIDDRVS